MYLSLDHLSDPGIAQRVRRAEAETRWTIPDMTMLITDEKKKRIGVISILWRWRYLMQKMKKYWRQHESDQRSISIFLFFFYWCIFYYSFNCIETSDSCHDEYEKQLLVKVISRIVIFFYFLTRNVSQWSRVGELVCNWLVHLMIFAVNNAIILYMPFNNLLHHLVNYLPSH